MPSSKHDRRERKCPRCRFHGITVPQRNHMRTCPFLRCDCLRCVQVRTEVRVPQRRRPRDQEQRPGAPSSVSPPGEAPPSATSNGPAAEEPLDLSYRPPGGEGSVGRVERSEEPPLHPTEASNGPSCNGVLETPPPTYFPLPVLMPVYHPESFAPYPPLQCTSLWVTPVSGAFFDPATTAPHPMLPPAAEAGLLAFWRRMRGPAPPPPPPPPPPRMNPFHFPFRVNHVCPLPLMNPYPSPTPETLQPVSPQDPELDVVVVDERVGQISEDEES